MQMASATANRVFGIAGRVDATPDDERVQFFAQAVGDQRDLFGLVRPYAETDYRAVLADREQLLVERSQAGRRCSNAG